MATPRLVDMKSADDEADLGKLRRSLTEPGRDHAWSSGVKQSNVGLRRRDDSYQRVDALEALYPTDPVCIEHLRSICRSLLRFDLWAAQTITEDYTPEQRMHNIKHHFDVVWKNHPRHKVIEGWLDSDQLYLSYEVMNLPSLRDFIENRTADELIATIKSKETHTYYIRHVLTRICKVRMHETYQKAVDLDRRAAFAISLGILIEDRPASEAHYVDRMVENKDLARIRLVGTVRESRSLVERISAAWESGALTDELRDALELKAVALDEHFHEAWALTGRRGEDKLLDKDRDVWLKSSGAPAPSPTLEPAAPARLAPPSPSPMSLAVLTFFCFLLAAIAAWTAYAMTADGPGEWLDANFLGLLSGAILSSLALGTQVFGPLLFPAWLPSRLDQETSMTSWLIGAAALICTVLSLVLYGTMSVKWSGVLALFAGTSGAFAQFLLVFGPQAVQKAS